jgi:hypothetical protein
MVIRYWLTGIQTLVYILHCQNIKIAVINLSIINPKTAKAVLLHL